MGLQRLALLALLLVGCAQHDSTQTAEQALSCNSALTCLDNDLCTLDLCVVNVCVNVAIPNCCENATDCDDANACSTDSCNLVTHQCVHVDDQSCCTSDATCVDQQVCTADHCDLKTNTCRHEPIFDCCVDTPMCSDASQCTTDVCNTGTNRCVHAAIPGCCTADSECHDNDSCTTDTCDVATGTCHNTDNGTCCKLAGDCADTDTCTADQCLQNSHTCEHTLQNGCCELDTDCADTDACTVDICDLSIHACINAAVTGCCIENADCADASSCTADTCNTTTHQCQHTGIANCCTINLQCNDGNECTTNTCNAQTGVCTITDIPGCCLTVGDCADDNPCTSDACDFQTHTCANEPVEGCCLGDAMCGDENTCTQDVCVLATHACDHPVIDNCCKLDSDCTDGDPCTTDSCSAGTCAHVSDPSCTGPTGGVDLSGGGCGCDTNGSTSAPIAILLVLAFVLLRRRNATILAVLVLAGHARADGFDAQLYQAATSSSGYLTQESGVVLPKGELDVNATLDFAHEPLVARDPGTGEILMNGDVVANRFGMQLTAGYGIVPEIEAGIALPLVLAQNGDPETLAMGRQLSTTALGDLRLFGKMHLVRSEALVLAAALDITLPTGNADSFTGNDTVAARPRLVLGFHQGAGALDINVGYRLQGRGTVANVTVDDEVTAGVAIAYAVRPTISLLGEAFLAAGVYGDDHAMPAEALVGARARVAGPWQLQLAVGAGLGHGYGTPMVETIASLGYVHAPPPPDKPIVRLPPPPPPPPIDPDRDRDGVLNDADACPDDAEDKDAFQDEDGCPDPDNDTDGILDAADKCPLEPEDKDTFEDDDGCPELDNDGDGIPDVKDVCPLQPEVKNGFQDDDGCPDEIPDKVKQFVGVIQGINFKNGSADLLPGTAKVLDEAVAVLTEFPDLTLEIQGHTDDQALGRRSKFKSNDELSQARAEAVQSYMSAMGVAASRLIAHGFGSQKPVDDPTGLKGAKLRAARAKNRRVEFQIVVAPSTGPSS